MKMHSLAFPILALFAAFCIAKKGDDGGSDEIMWGECIDGYQTANRTCDMGPDCSEEKCKINKQSPFTL